MYVLKHTIYFFIIFFISIFNNIFALNTVDKNDTTFNDTTLINQVDFKKKDKISWAIKKLYKAQELNGYNFSLDFENTNYYNPKKRIIKNVIFKLSKYALTGKRDEIAALHQSLQVPDIFKKNSKKLNLQSIGEFDESVKNLQKLFDFIQENYHADSIDEGLQTNLIWPFNGRILSNYGQQKKSSFNASIFENGIKIKADFAENVQAVEKGVVIYSDWLYGFGKIIIIGHGKGFYTVYGYLSEILIETGSIVSKGQNIGKIGDSESAIGTCLYFEIRKDGKSIDPKELLAIKEE
ncbi:peptidoglycan DD-metalloendopeptidase family protein [Candidatus Poribacteria bacterium]|nr:peptidoglycan DD-metalloendopeptidase family protein [Candidatus Poribacteria bacterium]